MSSDKLLSHAVILAGGRGTRFWPRSRARTPKQLLNIVGQHTMLEQTVERLAPLFPPSRTWIVTNTDQAAMVKKQLPRVPDENVLSEPVGRNTAAAIGLAAAHISASGAAQWSGRCGAGRIAGRSLYCRGRTLPQNRSSRSPLGGNAGSTGGAGHTALASGDRLWLHRNCRGQAGWAQRRKAER